MCRRNPREEVTMQPTCELRFVERIEGDENFGLIRSVLQQKWISQDGLYNEWRDIPLVSEGST
jgi:hypothetical protein